ncbi:hypothetical protein BKA70DRAFT_1437066 [Coprinopsis sp. MPI-PUGE-AT-0042]|nr:hypothetical protein BKA70DRAFT_1437066 [Coprinopsis sp. MPI-PUGE-AT-0042]
MVVPPGTCGYEEEFLKTLGDVSKRWKFLGPFFATHGYYVYQGLAHCFTTPPDNIPLPSAIDYAHPFSRIDGLTDRDLGFDHAQASFSSRIEPRILIYASGASHLGSTRLFWARGRDQACFFPGRGIRRTQDICLLNTPQARKDPRNHTVPVIDWLEYSGLNLWGDPLIGMVQLSTEQLLHYGDTLLEGLALSFTRTGLPIATSLSGTQYSTLSLVTRFDEGAALLDPSVARFAFIDFDASAILPMGWVYLRARVTLSKTMSLFAPTLQTYTRVLEAEIPEIGLFFDKYLADLAAPPSAAVVLAAFRKLRSSLTREQLNHIPKERFGNLVCPAAILLRLTLIEDHPS